MPARLVTKICLDVIFKSDAKGIVRNDDKLWDMHNLFISKGDPAVQFGYLQQLYYCFMCILIILFSLFCHLHLSINFVFN